MKEITEKLHNHEEMNNKECFAIAKNINEYFCSLEYDEIQKGRNLLILVLDNWENIDNGIKYIFAELIESAGFYPYLEKIGIKLDDFDSTVRQGYYKSSFLEGKSFHSEQKKLANIIFDGQNVIVSAPTSFGKSLLIEEIIASRKYKNIVVIQPTLALLDETRNKLKKYDFYYKIIVRTTQEIDTKRGNIFLLTAERVQEYIHLPPIDFFILDEFYKLSNIRKDNRSSVLNNAFLKIMKNNPQCQFYFLGPNIDSISQGFEERYNAVFYKTSYSMVVTEKEDLFDGVSTKRGGKVEEDSIFTVLDGADEQTLIFCSSPSTARKLAFEYSSHLEDNGTIEIDELPMVQWIDENITYNWSLKRCLKFGVAVHDGCMPKHIATSTIQYFNTGKLKYLFCTNTIIEGVNTSAKNVIYYDNKIGTRCVDYFDYANIRGRAGRLMEHYVGKIINLKEPPKEVAVSVDLPFFDQNPIEEEILVNLPEDNVKDINDNIKRYNDFHVLDSELQDILVRNSITIEGQKNILSILEADLLDPVKRDLIIWSNIDSRLYDRITYLINICWDNLSIGDDKRTYGNKNVIINKIVSCCFRVSISEMIQNDVEFQCRRFAQTQGAEYILFTKLQESYEKRVQQIIDATIERIFGIQKNWFQYRAPKWINVVDSLQKYACKKLGVPSGDYSYVAEMIENNFIHSALRVLYEYGVPTSAIAKIQFILASHRVNLDKIDEDQALTIIKKHLGDITSELTDYEAEILERVI